MLVLKVYFIFFLYFTTIKSEVLRELNKRISHNVNFKTSNTDDNVLNITFKNSEKFYILIHYPQNRSCSVNEVYSFYTALNCKFADWTLSKINDFVKQSPLLYNHKFQSYEKVSFKDAFQYDFYMSMKTLVGDLNKYVERFIDIINNFLETNSHISYYNDTSILEILVSIRIKMNYVVCLRNDTTDNIGLRYFNIIRMFVKEITTLQSVLSLNCMDVPFSYRNSQFYGYWISVDDVENSNGIHVFISNLKKIKLESDNCLDCKSTSMFLEMFIVQSPTPPENQILFNIADAYISDNRLNDVSIQDIFDRILVNFDIELIYWYQNLLLKTIMKIIFHNIQTISIEKLPDEIRRLIFKIHEKISEDHTKIPGYLVDGFKVLASSLNKPFINQEDEILLFLSSLDFINYKDNILSCGKDYSINAFLNEIMTKLLNNFEYLVCFQHYHRVLHDRYSKFYILPMVKDRFSLIPSRFLMPSQEISYNENVCKFLLNVYSMCYGALMLYQEGNDSYIGSVTLIDESFDILNKILRYLLIILTEPTLDRDLVKMALKMIPLLVNMLKQFENGLSISVVKRILNVIMNELNINGLKYCNLSQTNILLFNNINFLEFGNYELNEASVVDFFHSIYSNFNEDNLKKDCTEFSEYRYFILNDIYSDLIENSNVYKLYENDILVYWKGQKKNIKHIYKNITNVIFNPYTFYAFYEIIYAFYAAVLYSEVLRLPRDYRFNYELVNVTYSLDHFQSYIFPIHFRPLALDIRNLFWNNQELKTSLPNIYEQFKKFNIVFETSFLRLWRTCTFTKKIFCSSIDKIKINIQEIETMLTLYSSCTPSFIKS